MMMKKRSEQDGIAVPIWICNEDLQVYVKQFKYDMIMKGGLYEKTGYAFSRFVYF